MLISIKEVAVAPLPLYCLIVFESLPIANAYAKIRTHTVKTCTPVAFIDRSAISVESIVFQIAVIAPAGFERMYAICASASIPLSGPHKV